jgi:CDP-diacylglycerol--serine O-phosphatidyltransferase
LSGLLFGVSSIYFSSIEQTTAAMVAMLWALLCDWFDGPIARRTKGRTDLDRAFGGELDSLADLVCCGVAPGMLLLSVSSFDPWFLPGAFLLCVAGAIRLAHFNVAGEEDSYVGLPIDTNIIVVSLVIALQDLLGEQQIKWLLYAAIVTLAGLNVATFRMKKPSLKWYYLVAAYVFGMTALHAPQLSLAITR